MPGDRPKARPDLNLSEDAQKELSDILSALAMLDVGLHDRLDAVLAASTETVTGISLIAAERARQIAAEGWSEEHDDAEHQAGELAAAAAAYALAPGSKHRMEPNGDPRIPDVWPWEQGWWKPKWTSQTGKEGRLRELVVAGALLAAEIDRLQRGMTS